jgi:hypothetical protein
MAAPSFTISENGSATARLAKVSAWGNIHCPVSFRVRPSNITLDSGREVYRCSPPRWQLADGSGTPIANSVYVGHPYYGLGGYMESGQRGWTAVFFLLPGTYKVGCTITDEAGESATVWSDSFTVSEGNFHYIVVDNTHGSDSGAGTEGSPHIVALYQNAPAAGWFSNEDPKVVMWRVEQTHTVAAATIGVPYPWNNLRHVSLGKNDVIGEGKATLAFDAERYFNFSQLSHRTLVRGLIADGQTNATSAMFNVGNGNSNTFAWQCEFRNGYYGMLQDNWSDPNDGTGMVDCVVENQSGGLWFIGDNFGGSSMLLGCKGTTCKWQGVRTSGNNHAFTAQWTESNPDFSKADSAAYSAFRHGHYGADGGVCLVGCWGRNSDVEMGDNDNTSSNYMVEGCVFENGEYNLMNLARVVGLSIRSTVFIVENNYLAGNLASKTGGGAGLTGDSPALIFAGVSGGAAMVDGCTFLVRDNWGIASAGETTLIREPVHGRWTVDMRNCIVGARNSSRANLNHLLDVGPNFTMSGMVWCPADGSVVIDEDTLTTTQAGAGSHAQLTGFHAEHLYETSALLGATPPFAVAGGPAVGNGVALVSLAEPRDLWGSSRETVGGTIGAVNYVVSGGGGGAPLLRAGRMVRVDRISRGRL